MPQPLDADISVTACQLNALLAAKAAGLEVNPNIVAKAIEYVRSCQNPDGGFSYMARQQGGGSSGWPRSAAAVAVLIHGDTRLVDDALVRGIRYASETAPLADVSWRELRRRGIQARIAAPKTPHGSGLGKQRWVVERTIAWLHQYRRLRVRYERRDDIHEAFLAIGCSLICLKLLHAENSF